MHIPKKLGLEKYVRRAMMKIIAHSSRNLPRFFIQHKEGRYASNI